MTKYEKCILIFSGYNQRAVISFCRICDKYDIPYKIISSCNDTIKYTIYSKKIIYNRKDSNIDLSLLRKIRLRIKDYNKIVILPNSEYINRFILKNKIVLEEIGFEIPLVEKSLYDLISDKYSFGQICRQEKVDIPKEINSDNVEYFPVVVKPKKYFCKNKKIISPIIAKNKDELSNILEEVELRDIYIQEFIEGKSYYLLYYFCKNGKVVSFSQQNILQQDRGKSIIAAKASQIHLKDIGTKFKNIFKGLSFEGLVMIELKSYDNKFYMIEANPRLWGPSQLFVDANVKLFELFIRDLGFEIKIDKYCINFDALYFWEGGIKELDLHGREMVYYDDFVEDDKIKYRKYDVYNREDTKDIYYIEMIGDKSEHRKFKKTI